MTRATRSIPDPGRSDHLDHLHDQTGRHVVDDEPAEVLEGRRRPSTARPPTSRVTIATTIIALIGTPAVRTRRGRRATSSGSQERVRSSSRDAARTARPPPSALTRRARRAGPVPECRRGCCASSAAAALAVEHDGEAVGLVADALEQVERIGAPAQAYRVARIPGGRPPRTAWRATPARSHRRGPAHAPRARPRRAGPCRRRRPAGWACRRSAWPPSAAASGALLEPEAARQHLLHGGVVVVARHGLDREVPVVRRLASPSSNTTMEPT